MLRISIDVKNNKYTYFDKSNNKNIIIVNNSFEYISNVIQYLEISPSTKADPEKFSFDFETGKLILSYSKDCIESFTIKDVNDKKDLILEKLGFETISSSELFDDLFNDAIASAKESFLKGDDESCINLLGLAGLFKDNADEYRKKNDDNKEI